MFDRPDIGSGATRPGLVALATLAAATLAGCVTLNIEDREGKVRVVRNFGVLRVDVENPRRSVVGSIAGVGIVDAPLGWSLGFTRQRWALLGDDCRAVVWPPEGGLDEVARMRLVQAAGVCLLAGDADHSRQVAVEEAKP
jgi:hypothetical protein